MGKGKFFEEINIWKIVDERTVARYRCFKVLPDGTFFVQSKDHIYEDSDEKHRESLDDYFFGSLSKENFEVMTRNASDTVEEAIAKHEEDFKEMVEAIEEPKEPKF